MKSHQTRKGSQCSHERVHKLLGIGRRKPASPAKVTAEFKDGVLTVHLAKTEQAKPQHIEVKVS